MKLYTKVPNIRIVFSDGTIIQAKEYILDCSDEQGERLLAELRADFSKEPFPGTITTKLRTRRGDVEEELGGEG